MGKTEPKIKRLPKPPTGWQDGCELVEFVPAVDFLFNHPLLKDFAEMKVPILFPPNDFLTTLSRWLVHYTRRYNESRHTVEWIQCEGPVLYLSGANRQPEYKTKDGGFYANVESKRFEFWRQTLSPQTEELVKNGKPITDRKIVKALDALNKVLDELLGLSFWYMRCFILGNPISADTRVIPAFTSLKHLGVNLTTMRHWAYCPLPFEIAAYLEIHTETAQKEQDDIGQMRVFFPWEDVNHFYKHLPKYLSTTHRRKADPQSVHDYREVIKQLTTNPGIQARSVTGTNWTGDTLKNAVSSVRSAIYAFKDLFKNNPNPTDEALENTLRDVAGVRFVPMCECLYELRDAAKSQDKKNQSCDL